MNNRPVGPVKDLKEWPHDSLLRYGLAVVHHLLNVDVLSTGKLEAALRLLFTHPGIRTVNGWADDGWFSRRTLGRWCQRAGVPSPRRWVQFSCVLRATFRIARHPDWTLTHVARDTGHPDPYAMSNQMKRVIGARPSEVREQPAAWSWQDLVDIWIARERAAGFMKTGS